MTRIRFQQSLEDLKENLLVMAGLAEQGIQRAIESGVLPAVDVFIATQAIFGSTFWIYKWYDAKRHTPEDVLHQFLRMIGIAESSAPESKTAAGIKASRQPAVTSS